MGVAPLPFDPRQPCFCHQNCSGFKRPTSRWWVRWENAPPAFPIFATGILLDFDSGLSSPNFCLFKPIPDIPGIALVRLDLSPVAPIPGTNVQQSALAAVGGDVQVNQIIVFNPLCDATFTIAQSGGTLNLGLATLTPIRWYQNADDVPH